MKSFHGKVAAITGAGSGIGRALALELAQAGCDLALSDINQNNLIETANLLEKFGVRVTTAKVDVSKQDEVASWAQQVVNEHSKVNMIFNNAGVAHAGTVADTSYADYEWVLSINFWGVVYGTKEFLPHLISSGDGHVINISSVFGIFAQPMVSAYNASKFAVRGFTEALRQELDMQDNSVSASCVLPGGIKTNIAQSARVDPSIQQLSGQNKNNATSLFEKLLNTSAQEAAQTILRGVLSNKRRILIGMDARAADALQRSAPAAYQKLVTTAIKRLQKNKH